MNNEANFISSTLRMETFSGFSLDKMLAAISDGLVDDPEAIFEIANILNSDNPQALATYLGDNEARKRCSEAIAAGKGKNTALKIADKTRIPWVNLAAKIGRKDNEDIDE